MLLSTPIATSSRHSTIPKILQLADTIKNNLPYRPIFKERVLKTTHKMSDQQNGVNGVNGVNGANGTSGQQQGGGQGAASSQPEPASLSRGTADLMANVTRRREREEEAARQSQPSSGSNQGQNGTGANGVNGH